MQKTDGGIEVNIEFDAGMVLCAWNDNVGRYFRWWGVMNLIMTIC